MVEPITRFLFPKQYKEFLESKERLFQERASVDKMRIEIENLVNQRVAQTLLQMDPFEPLLRKYKGSFSEVYERPEDKLDATGRMKLMMLGYHLNTDPSFKYFIQWMLDTEGNNYIRKGNPTPESMLYSRAMLAAPTLMKREIRRLAALYEDEVERNKPEEFNEDVTVE